MTGEKCAKNDGGGNAWGYENDRGGKNIMTEQAEISALANMAQESKRIT
jgi:hypothetical protein